MKSKYVLIRNGRGIVIEIDILVLSHPQILSTDTAISKKIFLRFNMTNDILKSNFNDVFYFSRLAFAHLSDKINAILEDAPHCYYIQSVDFHVAHYQKEGLYCAFYNWIKEYYKIELPEIKVDLNLKDNKYVFHFSLI